jgi:hypothetical protein
MTGTIGLYPGAAHPVIAAQVRAATIRPLRALVEVSGWMHSGQHDAHAGHPWLATGPAFAARLTAATGVAVRSR